MLPIQAKICTLNPDIVRISKLWIPDNKLADSFAFGNYTPFTDCRKGRRGGGVLMLIKAELHPRAVRSKRIYDSSQCNVVCTLIGPAEYKTLNATVYNRTPDTSSYESQLLFQHLTQTNDTASVRTKFGDFNLLYSDWLNPA